MLKPVPSETPPTKPGAVAQNVEAEQALLGSLLVNNNMLDRITDRLLPEHFYDSFHGRIFEVVSQRIRNGHGVSPTTLKSHFAQDEAMAELGGAAYLVRLAEAAVSIRNANDYARTVYGLALRRMLIQLGDEIRDEASDGASPLSPEEQIEKAERDLYLLGEKGKLETGIQPFAELVVETINQASKARTRGHRHVGLPTGLTDLDRLIGGLQNSDLIVIAGRTAMGKSALAMHLAFSVARYIAQEHDDPEDEADRVEREARGWKRGGPVLYFSLEMASRQIATRVIAGQAEIPSQNVARGRMSDEEFQQFVRIGNEIHQLPLMFDETAALNIETLCARARRMKRQQGLTAIFVDYLQLVESSQRHEGRVQQVAEVSRRLKGLAKELDVPVVALAQLSRQVESREKKQPQLSDLRESGSIEQDADIVALLHRDEYYLDREKPDESDVAQFQKWEAEMDKVMNVAKLLVAKHRNGPTASLALRFNRHFTAFGDLQRDTDPGGARGNGAGTEFG